MTMAPDDMLLDDWEDHANRFVEAVALGQIADSVFEATCRRLKLSVAAALRAPIDSVLMQHSGGSDARH